MIAMKLDEMDREELIKRLENGTQNLWVLQECAKMIRARDAEIARLREALDKVAINAEQAQALYDRNGPTWTSRETGIEYENTADHLAFANELAAFARAALEASHDAKPEGK